MKVGEFNRAWAKRMTLRIERSESTRGTRAARHLRAGIGRQVGNDRSRQRPSEGAVPVDRRSGRILFRLRKRAADPGLCRNSRRPGPESSTSTTFRINLPQVDSFRQRGMTSWKGADPVRAVARQGIFAGRAMTRSNGWALSAEPSTSSIVEVLMMLMLPLLAVALAVPPKRSARRWASSSAS